MWQDLDRRAGHRWPRRQVRSARPTYSLMRQESAQGEMSVEGPGMWWLWAKTPRSGRQKKDGYHPLVYHCLDVAAVAEALWHNSLPPLVRARLGEAIGARQGDEAGCWIAYLAGLHDLGKASPVFAGMWGPARKALARAGYSFPAVAAPVPHGHITAAVMDRMLRAQGSPHYQAKLIARILGAHHGVYPQDFHVQNARSRSFAGGPEWETARTRVADAIRRAVGITGGSTLAEAPANNPWLVVFLAGLISVADWIGSDEQRFPYHPPGLSPDDYWILARAHAASTLRDLAWASAGTPRQISGFTDLFPDYLPNELQALAVQLGGQLQHPSLTLIETPTGSGKTEAALYLADHAERAHQTRGMYFALPTQATSNQMFGRVSRFLSTRQPDGKVNIQLLHGHASLSAEFEVILKRTRRSPEPSGVHGEKSHDGAPPGIVAAEWFTYRKRGLLAPYGIGTVDQALLAVLQTRHYFVRLSGLAGKVVIVDEVHAYDTYMATVLDRLLGWLASLDCSVILLSATLPARRRADLISAYTEGLASRPVSGVSAASPLASADVAIHTPYPRVSWCEVLGPPASGSRSARSV